MPECVFCVHTVDVPVTINLHARFAVATVVNVFVAAGKTLSVVAIARVFLAELPAERNRKHAIRNLVFHLAIAEGKSCSFGEPMICVAIS